MVSELDEKKINDHVSSFIKKVKKPFYFRFFLLTKLPMAFLAGTRLIELNENECVVSVPFKWLNQNPFRSTYFAVLSMAAEMSTGLPCLMYATGYKPVVSMLVAEINARFSKKATGRTRFVFKDVEKIRNAVFKAVETGEPQTVKCLSTGYSDENLVESEFEITWTFRQKRV